MDCQCHGDPFSCSTVTTGSQENGSRELGARSPSDGDARDFPIGTLCHEMAWLKVKQFQDWNATPLAWRLPDLAFLFS